MKITKKIEVTVCDFCGEELNTKGEYLDVSIYAFVKFDESKYKEHEIKWRPFSTTLTRYNYYANLVENRTIEQHELTNHFCDWECFTKYVKGEENEGIA